MKVLMMEPGKRPYSKELNSGLKSVQSAVGGLIQILTPFEDPAINLVCNDEGKLMGLPLNRGLRHPETGELYDVISGTFFLCGDSDGELCSLTEAQIKEYTERYYVPELFVVVDGVLCCLPMELPDSEN